jgi:hypothetical protein
MRPLLGLVLILHGGLGLLLVALGVETGLDAAARAERLSTSADRALIAAIGAADAATDAFGEADVSLEEARASTESAASLARDASVTLAALSEAMRLSVFGAQPLLPLAADFADTAEQADRLSVELDTVGGSLGSLREDLGRVATELRTLADQLDELRGSESEPTTSTPPFRLLLILVLAWVWLFALASVGAGLTLLRAQRPAVTP